MSKWQVVADVVNARMAERDILQRDLAEKARIGVSTLRSIQSGEDRQRSRATLANLSRALGFPEDYLWGVSESGEAGDVAGTITVERLQGEIAELRQRVEAIETKLAE